MSKISIRYNDEPISYGKAAIGSFVLGYAFNIAVLCTLPSDAADKKAEAIQQNFADTKTISMADYQTLEAHKTADLESEALAGLMGISYLGMVVALRKRNKPQPYVCSGCD